MKRLLEIGFCDSDENSISVAEVNVCDSTHGVQGQILENEMIIALRESLEDSERANSVLAKRLVSVCKSLSDLMLLSVNDDVSDRYIQIAGDLSHCDDSLMQARRVLLDRPRGPSRVEIMMNDLLSFQCVVVSLFRLSNWDHSLPVQVRVGNVISIVSFGDWHGSPIIVPFETDIVFELVSDGSIVGRSARLTDYTQTSAIIGREWTIDINIVYGLCPAVVQRALVP